MIKHLYFSCLAVLFAVCLLTAGCADKKPKPEKPPQPAKFEVREKGGINLSHNVKIAVIPFVDQTGFSKWAGWPRDEARVQELTHFLHEINENVKNALGRYSKLNRVKIIDQSQMPEFRIQLVFLKVQESAGSVTSPFEIRVYDQSAQGRDFSVSFNHSIKLEQKSKGERGQFVWKAFLGQLKSEYPYSEIAEKLFTSKDGSY